MWFIALITCRSIARNCYNSKEAKIWFKYNTLRLKNDESYVILFISPYNIIVTRHNFRYNVVKDTARTIYGRRQPRKADGLHYEINSYRRHFISLSIAFNAFGTRGAKV